MTHGFTPMLAEPGSEIPSGPGWALEPKLNGFRLVAGHHGEPDDDDVWLEARTGTRFTNVPYLNAAIALNTPVDTILDGELYSSRSWGDVQSVVRSKGIHVPDARRPPLDYAVFDLLVLEGEDLRREPLRMRREKLEGLARTWTTERLRLVPQVPASHGEGFYDRCVRLGFEGVMAKKLDSTYRSGRRYPTWVKLKAEYTIDVVVTAIYPSDEPDSWLSQEGLPGALGFSYHDPATGGFTPEVGRVGTGFSREQREDIRDHEVDWLGAVIEVKHMEALPSGSYRHPVFIQRRDDKQAEQATRQGGTQVQTKTKRRVRTPQPDVEGAPESPVRSGSGRVRNLGAMGDGKLNATAAEMEEWLEEGGSDREGVAKLNGELRTRGMDPVGS